MLLFTFDQLQLNPLSQSIALFKMPKQESNCHPVKILRKSGPSKKKMEFWHRHTPPYSLCQNGDGYLSSSLYLTY